MTTTPEQIAQAATAIVGLADRIAWFTNEEREGLIDAVKLQIALLVADKP